jgi:hypothetical protein
MAQIIFEKQGIPVLRKMEEHHHMETNFIVSRYSDTF